MNIILLTEEDFVAPGRAVLADRRLQHIMTVLAGAPEQVLNIGLLSGQLGRGRILGIDCNSAVLDVSFDRVPPTPSHISLLLALPRPKSLRRILQAVTSLGIKKIVLLNSYRVEKSYWQSPLLDAAALREQLLLGLEQACDTILPQIQLRRRFKPFVEDELPDLVRGTHCLTAHPGASVPCPANIDQPTWLAIGPEGGFIPYEIDKLRAAGFREVHCGTRILRVETAVPALIGRLSAA